MQRRFTGLLLRPSFFSSVINTFATVLILGTANWSGLLDKLGLSPYVFGPEGIVGRLREGSSSYEAVFGGNVSYSVLIFSTAIFVGITVYISLRISSHLANDASAAWESLQAQTERGARDIAQRSAIRVAVAIIWLLYITLFMKLILPWCILATQTSIEELGSAGGWALLALGSVSLWIAWHIHTIFIRLLFLRPRVFGGNDALLADEFRSHAFKESPDDLS